MRFPPHASATFYPVVRACSRGQLKCDGTRAETRFRLSAKRTSPFKSAGASVQSTTDSRGVRISGSNAGYTMFRGSVKGTGYPLHSPVSPSHPSRASLCAITFQLDSTYYILGPIHPTVVWTRMRRENSVNSNVNQSLDHVDHNLVTTLTELSLLRNTERGMRTYSWEQNCSSALQMSQELAWDRTQTSVLRARPVFRTEAGYPRSFLSRQKCA